MTQRSHSPRLVLAGAALGTVLTLGGAGLAGAATSNGPASGTTPTPAKCAKAPQVEARIQHRLTRISTLLPKMEAREQKAQSSGHTKAAQRIAKRITEAKSLQTKGQNRLAKIEAKCGAVGTSTPATTSATTA